MRERNPLGSASVDLVGLTIQSRASTPHAQFDVRTDFLGGIWLLQQIARNLLQAYTAGGEAKWEKCVTGAVLRIGMPSTYRLRWTQ